MPLGHFVLTQKPAVLLLWPYQAHGVRLKSMLEASGFCVHSAITMMQAQQLLGQYPMRMMLLPWQMPLSNQPASTNQPPAAHHQAADLLTALRRRHQAKCLPAVVLDNGMPLAAKVAFVKAGATSRMPMPPSKKSLQQTLALCLDASTRYT